jgi:Hint domain
MADSTFTWIAGTSGLASDPSNWIMTGVTNTPNVPDSDDNIIITAGDAQFVNTMLPGAETGTHGASVLLQGGTIDMINSSGSAGVLSNTLVEATNTVATNATLTSSGGSINNGTIDADANATLTFSIVSGNATNAGVIEAVNGGAVLIEGSAGTTFTNNGAVTADGGQITVAATLTPTPGMWTIGDSGAGLGGLVELNTPATSVATFDFLDTAGTLQLDQVTTFAGTLLEFGGGDTVGLGAVNVGAIIVTPTGNANQETMVLQNAGGTVITTMTQVPFGNDLFAPGTFTVNPTSGVAGDFTFASMSGDETMTGSPSEVACFVAGTRIATPHGDIPVEKLRVGDKVVTLISVEPARIVWIGRRVIDCARHPTPRQVWPVRIAAGTLGRGQPSRDVMLSPDHGVYVDGGLIPAKYLIDGAGIAQIPAPVVTYYHIELPRHDVVLAEGLPAESYLARADRGTFGRSGTPVALFPDMASRVWEAEGCAPLVVTGPALETARQRIARRRHAA